MSDHSHLILWAGTEFAFNALVEAQLRIEAAIKAGSLFSAEDDEEKPSRLLSVSNGIGVIQVAGPLTSSNDPWNKYMGITGYGEIRDALLQAAKSAEVKNIILDINSGGGTVSGLSDVATLISNINDTTKPVVAFTDGNMMSAAYWLGSSAGHVFASQTANVGSIGVILTHMERSKMLEEAGVKVTVLRAGEFKALANPYEPLSAEAKKQIQASLDEAYRVFVSHVAEARQVSYETADKQMAQGREFFGQAAKDAGLVDGITSFDKLAAKLQAIDNSQVFH